MHGVKTVVGKVRTMDDEERLWQQLQPTLWQYIEKVHIEHMILVCSNDGMHRKDDEEPISDEEWELFIHTFQDAFANEVSVLALEYWNDRYENGMFLFRHFNPNVESSGEEE